MPIYEYHCEDCAHDFEKLVRFTDPKINTPECPDCQSDNTHKRLSMIAAFGGINAQTSSASGCGSSGPFR